MIDGRAGTLLANKIGNDILELVSAEVKKVSDNVIFYKIEGDYGVLVGYFSLIVNTGNFTAVEYQKNIRPNFINFTTEIQQKINTFILNGEWRFDILLPN